MIVSHKYKFIFFKTRKTAGTTMEVALSKFCGSHDILSPLSKEEEEIRSNFSGLIAQNYLLPIWSYSLYDVCRCFYYRYLKGFWDHADAKEVKSYLPPDVWENYFKFAFDRNPWDKVVSFYHWSNVQKKFANMDDFLANGRVNIINSFEQLSINGIVAVDKIYKYEEMESAIEELTDVLKLPQKLSLPDIRLKGDIRKDIRHYSEIFTENQRLIIQRMFAREIELMGYKY